MRLFSLANTAPILSSSIKTPDSLPCLDPVLTKSWEYSFPQAIDFQGEDIIFTLECVTIQSDLILQNIEDNILKLELDPKLYL